MKRALLFSLGVALLAACAAPEDGLVVSIPSREAAPPPGLSGSKDVVLEIFEESLLARGPSTPEGRDFVNSLRSSLNVVPFGPGIWEVQGKGRFVVRELGRSIRPMDAEARQLLATLESMAEKARPSPTAAPTVSPSPLAPKVSPTPTPAPTPSPTAVSGTTTPSPMAIATAIPTPTPLPVPPGWGPYRNQLWKYSLYIPSGWNTEESDPQRVTMSSPEGDTTIKITAGPMGKSLDEWLQEMLGTIERRHWGFELKSKERFKGAGFEGWKLAYVGKPGSAPMVYEYRDLLATDGETGFWVSSYTRQGYSWVIPALELVVESFRPTVLPASPPWWQVGP